MFYRLKSKILNLLRISLLKVNNIPKSIKLDRSVILSGAYIAENVKIGKESHISKTIIRKNTQLGNHNFIKDSELTGRVETEEGCKIYGCELVGKIHIGRYSSLWGPNVQIKTSKQQVVIGNFCSIARNVYMQTFNHNHKKLSTYYMGKNIFREKWENERTSNGDIVIENDVWIGANVTILGGVTIGNGALVAANSVVTKNIPPYAIVAGVPAKIINYRFDPLTIKKIQQMAWWNWPIEKIKNNKTLFEKEFSIDNLNLMEDNE